MSEIAYNFLYGAMTMLSLTGLWFTFIMPGLDHWNRRFFKILFSVLSLSMLSYLADLIAYGLPDPVMTLKVSWCFESIFMTIPMPMLTVYLLHCCGEDIGRSPLIRVVLVLWLVDSALALVSPFTSFLYAIGPDMQFIRGPWYPAATAPLILILVVNLRAVMKRRAQLSKRIFYAFLINLIPLMAAIIIHSFVLIFLLVYIGISISSFAMFYIILFDQIEQYMHQQREIARQQASILILQMRPHFIYNTMTSIYYLCDQDPQKAKQVTLDFTTYLRRNFTAIASGDTIPFAEALEHTRAYLAVEQAQFDEGLFVDYDTAYTQFRLPPLTLQPIVENAVKHGMDPEAAPLHITIRTCLRSAVVELIITDNGPGYTPADDNEPHIALKNIRQRLEMMCGGKLLILPNEGGGTAVKVLIPLRRALTVYAEDSTKGFDSGKI